MKHFLSITDLSKKDIYFILELGTVLKKELKQKGKNKEYLKNKTLAMVFEKPSLRTRVSFETGMSQLAGHAIYLAPADIAMGKREAVSDVAKVLSSMADIIMARTFSHKTIIELAKYSLVPVINGLSDLEHPCQILADLLTIWEIKKKLKGLTIGYVGDGENNIPHSLCLASAILGINFNCGSPDGFSMNTDIIKKAKILAKKTGAKIMETKSAKKALTNVDIVYTDTWVSMGDEKEKLQRLAIFKTYQVNSLLMKKAKQDAIFMHDLPAYRGNEVNSEVIDGKQSIVFQQAENRLHAQKALILFLLNKI